MDLQQECLRLIVAGRSHSKIGKELGRSKAWVSRIRNINNMGLQNPSTPKHELEIEEDVIEGRLQEKTTKKEEDGVHEIRHEGGEIKTKEDFLKQIEFDDKNFEIVSYQCNLRPVVIRNGRNETILVKKYEHFLRTKMKEGANMKSYIDILEENLSKLTYTSIDTVCNSNLGKMLELCLFDAHINKKSYSSPEWNSQIAKEEYLKMIAKMIHKAKKIDIYEKCVLVIGNDFLNSDNNSKTTRGTAQDNTESEEESFAIGLEILVSTIEYIQRELGCEVDVISIPGNHAQLLETVMGISLKHIFRMNKSVSIDCESKSRKYYRFGNTAIMFSHGDGCKQDRMPMLFANEASELRGSTKYRQVHLGHIHTKVHTEVNGVIIKHLSSMTTTDKWHHEQGYVGNRRGGQMFIFDKEVGEEGEFTFYI